MPDKDPTAHAARPGDPPAIRMVSITKRFPGVIANQSVSLTVQPGTFHAVIGENGAGKSTLLNVLYGLYRPDEGRIFLGGEDVTGVLISPGDAIDRGLGLVSQHYALIPALTVLENIILGAEPARLGGILNRRAACERIQLLTHQLELEGMDLGARADRLSVAAGQKIEIVKALYRGTRTLLLDEPTATLAPQEAESLFALLRTLLANGTTIVFVTHKLREVMTYSQNVTVLRNGQNAGDFVTRETSPDELLSHMIGPRALSATMTNAAAPSAPAPAARDAPLLRAENISVKSRRGAMAVRNAFIEINAGEIVGVAGVDGSGQRELAEAIVGLRRTEAGRIELCVDHDAPPTLLNRRSVRERQRLGIAYIPEDRHRSGLVLDFSIAENYLLGNETETSWGGGTLLHPRHTIARADAMILRYDVRIGDRDSRAAARALSGGNQQKIVIARALDRDPRLLIASQPTRGLDVEAARFVYRTLLDAKSRGLGILVFSLDLDEILEISDRIVVMYNGQIAGVVPKMEATAEGIGALMTGAIDPGPAPTAEGGRL